MEVFDMHADIGYDVMQKRKQGYHGDILKRFHVDKLRKGGVSFLCMACNFEGEESWQDMQEMILALKEEIASCEDVDLILDKDTLLLDNGHIKAIITVEGMCGIREDAAIKVDWLYQQGVRIASLCWNDENALASGVRGNKEHGLSEMGREVIEKMMELNMAIDVSHANEKTFWDIMQYKNAVVLATHSNARDLCEHPRNLYKDQMKAIQEHQGIIGIVSAPFFVHEDKEKQDMKHMIEHMKYIGDVIGMDRICLGLDYMDFYEGYDEIHVKNLNDASFTQALLKEMDKELDEINVAMIALGNALRFLAKII